MNRLIRGRLKIASDTMKTRYDIRNNSVGFQEGGVDLCEWIYTTGVSRKSDFTLVCPSSFPLQITISMALIAESFQDAVFLLAAILKVTLGHLSTGNCRICCLLYTSSSKITIGTAGIIEQVF